MPSSNDRGLPPALSRRGVLVLLPLALGACATRRPAPAPAAAVSPFAPRYGALEDGGFRVPGVPADEMKARNRRMLVDDPTGQPAGTLVVDPANRFLYLVQENGKALRYGVGVGREGLEFSGTAEVAHKRAWPRWTPTPDMIAREPEKYQKWAGGMAGGESNPLGARALYLFKDGRDTLYRIHGTNEPWSIGEAVSSGCIRMMNQDVIDLYQRIPDGTKVVVLPAG
ncbi:L,D-transpeptidase [Ancylobacter sp. IITR112]|uniref:L,D-transpeptidase n=1 Tax=Ancylobacter sp. IITR112 TaxID=3138073 RepID=UPI003529FB70